MRITASLLILSISNLIGAEPAIRGFRASAVDSQRSLEARALAIPAPARAREYLERMSAEPHHAGSPGSRKVAEYALKLMKSWGLDARIEEFDALLPYPTERRLEMVAPRRFVASLAEPVVAADPDSADEGQLPTYNSYSASGDVTAELVYVNYGIPEDYKKLTELGIGVEGKIVIARYGKSWRGTKVKVAAEHGAVGCVIYSDPRDDGYFQGDVYPKGPFRPPMGVQRGSVMDMPLYTGDPLSPGWPSVKGTKRLPLSEAGTVMTIPVLPISHEEAQPLLEAIGGPVAPEAWRGNLPLTYHIGPGPAKVHLVADFDWTSKPFFNVVAVIKGAEFPEEWIIHGNHHDAWVNGARDPVSGAVALLETARALAELTKQGWQPRRTLVLALWDAEEFGLIGSTEWAEKHKSDLVEKAVAYLNTDSNGKGTLGTGGSPAFEEMMREVLAGLKDPRTGKTLLEAKLEKLKDEKPVFRLSALGAGSDYVAFFHHCGIGSLNLGFSGDDPGGIYHSIYDTPHWYRKFSDSDFLYSRALSQTMLTIILRLSEAELLPFSFGPYADAVERYADEIEKLRDDIGLDEVRAAAAKMRLVARDFDAASARFLSSGDRASVDRLTRINRVVLSGERALLRQDGLPRRSWYKHVMSAPGVYTGYGAKTLPGVREAVEAENVTEARQQAQEVVKALERLEARLQEATGLLSSR